MAHLVYPGALHTRFDHSLGTLHAAGRILDKVAKSAQMCEDDIITVRLAALLHDIGHGPFSHVSEYLLDRYHEPGQQAAGAREKIHERITVDIIMNESSIACLMTDAQREAVCNIIRGSNLRDVKRDIVSSDLDADKIDYLSRDAYFTGVKYGIFDLDKLYESFVFLSQGRESYLGIDESGIFATEQLIIAKYHMTQQVYAHRVRVITDHMIVRGLELAIKGGLDEIRKLYQYDGSPEFCRNYVKFYDDRVVDIIMNCTLDNPRSIYERLHSRRLFKQLLRLPLTDRYIDNDILMARYLNMSDKLKRNIERNLASYLKCECWEVIVEIKNVKNPAYQEIGTLNPEAILVQDRGGLPKFMSGYDEMVAGKLPSYNTLHVIAPYTWNSPNNQHSLSEERTTVEKEIREIIDKYIRGVA